MPLETLLLFTLMTVAMELTPGPAVLLVMSQGLRHGWRRSFAGAIGIELGNTLYFVLSALGLSAILLASEDLFTAIRWAGAAYLVYLGLRLLLSRGEVPEPSRAAAPRGALLAQGLLTQLANPKAMIYFTALLPQFVDPQGDVALQFLAFGLVTILTEIPVLLMYAWLAERGRRLAAGSVALRWFDRVAGTLLIGTGLRLAALSR